MGFATSSLFHTTSERDCDTLLRMCGMLISVLAFTGEKYLRMRRDINHEVDFRKAISLDAKSARNVVNMKEEMAAFLSVVVLWFCCHCERSKNILVEIFSDMRCLVDNASVKCQTNTLARSI